MSMILDALKKADAERHLGELPGLHSRAVPGLAPSHPASLWQRRATWLALAGLCLALLVLAWWLNRPVVPVALIAQPQAHPLQPVEVGASSAQLAADVAVPPPLARPVPKPAPRPAPKPIPALRTEPALPAAPVMVAGTTVPSTTAPSGPMLTLATLPPNLQRELPPLAIGGSMYSDNPADRMLLIDKRLVHEGDEVAPGLVLESLMPKSAILRYKGMRFRIAF
ncbi:general secretion pathway protein GspB [Actimicrobium antarcticum]|uniref:Type II secretion system protein GspB C-terminal domain-containing protein n=1 Tax=Actimicrobium antarcticum TaxID=1051899 RepID=A0ABP7SLF8_9BURK